MPKLFLLYLIERHALSNFIQIICYRFTKPGVYVINSSRVYLCYAKNSTGCCTALKFARVIGS